MTFFCDTTTKILHRASDGTRTRTLIRKRLLRPPRLPVTPRWHSSRRLESNQHYSPSQTESHTTRRHLVFSCYVHDMWASAHGSSGIGVEHSKRHCWSDSHQCDRPRQESVFRSISFEDTSHISVRVLLIVVFDANRRVQGHPILC